ncbi:dentin sialophosphoprotein [Trifolium pratense]|nr:dentin sialophosphoprotein [Trifolium pratense]
MRSKVERRMQKESGKTLREIRRAWKLKKKLMTEEERVRSPTLTRDMS